MTAIPISLTKAGTKVANLMIAAADEIERLQARVRELEAARVSRS